MKYPLDERPCRVLTAVTSAVGRGEINEQVRAGLGTSGGERMELRHMMGNPECRRRAMALVTSSSNI